MPTLKLQSIYPNQDYYFYLQPYSLQKTFKKKLPKNSHSEIRCDIIYKSQSLISSINLYPIISRMNHKYTIQCNMQLSFHINELDKQLLIIRMYNENHIITQIYIDLIIYIEMFNQGKWAFEETIVGTNGYSLKYLFIIGIDSKQLEIKLLQWKNKVNMQIVAFKKNPMRKVYQSSQFGSPRSKKENYNLKNFNIQKITKETASTQPLSTKGQKTYKSILKTKKLNRKKIHGKYNFVQILKFAFILVFLCYCIYFVSYAIRKII